MRLRNESGSILIVTLGFVLAFTLLGFGAIYFATVQNEAAERQIASTRAFWLAEAGGQEGLKKVDELINTDLRTTLFNAHATSVANITRQSVDNHELIEWLVLSTRENNAQVLIQNGEVAEYEETVTLENGDFTYTIALSESDVPIVDEENTWHIPFDFEINATGNSIGESRVVIIKGYFTVHVERDNFAKYALFTNSHTMPNSTTPVWFTNRTNFFGPVHTNGQFNFALNPSGTFAREVTQHEQTARFQNAGHGGHVFLDDDNNGTIDVPVFQSGFTRGALEIPMASTSEEQDMVHQATAGVPITTDGIFVPNTGGVVTGGIYVHGDGSVRLSTDANNNAVYTISQGGSTRRIIVDRVARQTLIADTAGGTVQTLSGLPQGMENAGTLLYVDGNVTSLSGNVQSETELTIASRNDIIVTDHLRYSDFIPASGTPGTPGYVAASAENTTNLMGLLAWNGNVRVGTTAPNNIEIHSTVMAPNGVFQVDDYTNETRGSRGVATLLGGVITNNYGAFGQFVSATATQASGYGRNFIYDGRMLEGRAPPYYPTLSKFIGISDDIMKHLDWREGP